MRVEVKTRRIHGDIIGWRGFIATSKTREWSGAIANTPQLAALLTASKYAQRFGLQQVGVTIDHVIDLTAEALR